MSDELPERSYSAFWPVLIILAAFVISYSIQLFEVISSRSSIVHQLDLDKPDVTVPNAEAVHQRFGKLVEDLVQTAQKDPNAALVVRQAIQAGILRVQRAPSNANSTNAAPASP
jgi:hypothetical protein